MAIFALSILGFLIMLMAGSRGLFRPTSEIFTYLNDSIAIAEGADVRLNGILIGKVSRVDLSGSPDPGRVVRVTMDVNNEYLPAIPVDSQAGLAAQNLLGVKYMNIKKGASAQAIQAGGELGSAVSPELTELFEQGSSTLAALQITLKRLDAIVAQVQLGRGNIGKLFVDEALYNKFMSITDEVHKLTVTLNARDSTLGRLINDDALYLDVRGTFARMNLLLDGLNSGEGTAGRLLKDPSLFNEFRLILNDVRELLAGLNRGEGTAGKLLKSEELHQQIQTTVGRLDTLLAKINSGEGTLGQLVVNPALYESLDLTTRELQGLLRDFRANPRKFLSIRLGLF